ncbi:SAM-dependent methyltransferase [uncultured Ruegeria sp.]|uniref:class I SAM-dependent methyltransferase n=1 Tax=uncultured Ruegeria sp. TaxID=259304 RepID=UPI002628E262|nr:SAM-dependent methyltransferase [uncultured Ruegeria sp.]
MSLLDHLTTRILQDGPISVAAYMTECLLHPTLGYYTTRDPLGPQGDFTTSPEISQMFGEVIGLCLAQSWMDQGQPSRFILGELGPGRGTLMADILHATRRVPGFHQAAKVVLLEVSPELKKKQAETLREYAPEWVGNIAEFPDLPLYLVANEFFDALPIRQFLRDGDSWRERLVGVSAGSLTFGLGPRTEQSGLKHRMDDTTDADLVELCSAATPILTTVAQKIATCGGSALIVDYGDWRSLGDTLQAMQNHKHSDPLENPGQADLTSHVDFEALAGAARAAGCAYTRLTPQGVFLERLGITARAQTLANSLEGSELEGLIAAHRRLTHPEEMGNLFKVLGLYPAQSAPPPGLDS